MKLCMPLFRWLILAHITPLFYLSVSASFVSLSDRVNGSLAVSRAFGDHALKSAGVCCTPYQQHVEITPAHKFLIIGQYRELTLLDRNSTSDANYFLPCSLAHPLSFLLLILLFHLLIGCDGIWDVMDGKFAVESVAGLNSAQAMADKLVELALKKGTTDNVSCMVIRFNQ